MLGCMAGGVAIYLGGWVRDAGMNVRGVFYILAALILGCAAIVTAAKPKIPAAESRSSQETNS